MRIVHNLHGRTEEKEGEAGFLLTNKHGDFFLQPSSQSFTSYQGLYFFDQHTWDYLKALESLTFEGTAPLRRLENWFSEAALSSESSSLTYLLAEGALVVDVQHKGHLLVTMDVRPIHSSQEYGRIYRVHHDDRFAIIEYTQYADTSLKQALWKSFVVILNAGRAEPVDRWVQKKYSYDAERGALSERYVYEAARIPCAGRGRLIITAAKNLVQAQVRALQAEKKADDLKSKALSEVREFPDLGLSSAVHAMQALGISIPGGVTSMFAGLPWFYQVWTRDELISAGALLSLGRQKDLKDVLWKYLGELQKDGRLPGRYPATDLGCADGTGWLFHRLGMLLETGNSTQRFFSREDLTYAFDRLWYALGFLNRHYGKNHLIWTLPKETWMDTDFGGDARDGARIEIQALHLSMCRVGRQLAALLHDPREKQCAYLEDTMRKRVRRLFFGGKSLADGIGREGTDWTVRPNVFLAAYLYPPLLSQNEWKDVFVTALNSLYLPWGGLASIDKAHHLFCPDYTGMDNRSYHRGDSWFFANNLAIVALSRVDSRYFSDVIEKMFAASTEEILWSGLAGHHAEVSSARTLSSKGCLAQGWSAAAYCEAHAALKAKR